MTIEEGNALIAKFVGINKKGKSYDLPIEYSKILKVKKIQNIPFNESFDLLFLALEKICTIKDLWCNTQQFQESSCYVCLYYKAELVEGEWRNARFSCERNKPLSKFKQALFEVISTFCGWYYNHLEYQREIEYELTYVEQRYSKNVVYMKPKEVICPDCKKVYLEEDTNEDKNK